MHASQSMKNLDYLYHISCLDYLFHYDQREYKDLFATNLHKILCLNPGSV